MEAKARIPTGNVNSNVIGFAPVVLLGAPTMPEETTASFVPRMPMDVVTTDGLVACRQIRAARAMLGWTQTDLGRALGVDPRQVRFWERRLPSNRQMRRKIVLAFATVGIGFIGPPAVGVCETAKKIPV